MLINRKVTVLSIMLVLFFTGSAIGQSVIENEQMIINIAFQVIEEIDTGNKDEVKFLLSESTKNTVKTESGIAELINNYMELKNKYGVPDKETAKVSLINLVVPSFDDTTQYKNNSMLSIDFGYSKCSYCSVNLQYYKQHDNWILDDVSVIFFSEPEQNLFKDLLDNAR